jgi:hypothetical protein
MRRRTRLTRKGKRKGTRKKSEAGWILQSHLRSSLALPPVAWLPSKLHSTFTMCSASSTAVGAKRIACYWDCSALFVHSLLRRVEFFA